MLAYPAPTASAARITAPAVLMQRPANPPPATEAVAAIDDPPPATVGPVSLLHASDAGTGTSASDFSVERWARSRRASEAHSGQARRWARNAPRSLRGRAPSSWRETARSA